MEKISRLLESPVISAIRLESLAEEDCHQKETKAIVQRIARIVMTTMSSTKVNPNKDFLFFCKDFISVKKKK